VQWFQFVCFKGKSLMTLEQFLISGLVYLAATVISALVARRLKLGSVLGFLIAGALIGPSALNLVGDNGETVKHFAEFGVIVMLFLIGLELEPSKLWALRKQILDLRPCLLPAIGARDW
jgi:Kef-type K+ transport system membrane component KefB